jgi:hypothetical protein
MSTTIPKFLLPGNTSLYQPKTWLAPEVYQNSKMSFDDQVCPYTLYRALTTTESKVELIAIENGNYMKERTQATTFRPTGTAPTTVTNAPQQLNGMNWHMAPKQQAPVAQQAPIARPGPPAALWQAPPQQMQTAAPIPHVNVAQNVQNNRRSSSSSSASSRNSFSKCELDSPLPAPKRFKKLEL